MSKDYDYSNKRVYIGIDVHKTTYMCVAISSGEIVKRDRLPAKPDQLVSYLQNNYKNGNLMTAYEAGFSGFHLHRYLLEHGIDNKVIHPGSLEVASRDRTKTDKRDAKKIAEHLSQGRISCIYIPSVDQESERNLTRLRRTLTDMQRQTSNRIKSLLYTRGLIPAEDTSVTTKKWLDKKELEIRKGNYHADFIYSFTIYKEEWFALSEKISTIKKKLSAKIKHGDKLRVIYKSAPGIGDIYANEIADELGDMRQFKNEKSLFNYLGLTPTEHSSGDSVKLGHISHQGRSVLRAIFVEAAWVAIRRDKSLSTIYNRISSTRGAKRAIVGVARRLAGRLRACVLTGNIYEIEAMTV